MSEARFRLDSSAGRFTIDEYLCMMMDKYAQTRENARIRRLSKRVGSFAASLMGTKVKTAILGATGYS
ncbi:MAG: hypothetical protein WBW85_20715, partial [Terriglobales bacterium]